MKLNASQGRQLLNIILFHFLNPDNALRPLAGLGIALSGALIAGFVNIPILATLWVLQLSFLNSGPLFYSYGWESALAEFWKMIRRFALIFRYGRSRSTLRCT